MKNRINRASKIITFAGVMAIMAGQIGCRQQPASPSSVVAEAQMLKVGQAGIFDPKGLVAKGAELVKLGEGFRFTEGPATDKEGNVFFTDQPNDRIIRWDAATNQVSTFLENTGRSNGMYFDAAGNLISCAELHGEVRSIDKNGNHTVLVAGYQGKPFNGPNDIWVAPNGGMYITDPLYKRDFWAANDPRREGIPQGGYYLYYVRPDRKSIVRADENLVKSNGVIGTPDGRKLYVSDIDDQKIYVYDIQLDGSLANRQLFCSMRSDGMTIDNQGNIYLTNALGVTAFSPSGEKVLNIPTGEGWTANVTFGGKDRSMLFITAMGAVYGLRMNVKGAN